MSPKDSDPSEFEKAMRLMGVRPLAKGERREPKRADPVEQVRPHVEPAPSPTASVDRVEKKAQREADLRFEVLEAEKRALVDERDALLAKSEELEQLLAQKGQGRVLRLLQERGLVSHEVQAEWFRELVDAGRVHGFLEQLDCAHSASVRRFLDGSVLLHCGQEACVRPGHLVAVRVPVEACEICGGLEIEAWEKVLSEKLLLSGIRRVQFRSQRLALLRWFLGQLDRRIQGRLAPLDVDLQLDAEAGPVVIWRIGGEDTSELPADYRIKAGSIGQFVTRLGYKLDED